MITTAGSTIIVVDTSVLANFTASPPALDHVPSLRQALADVSRLRYSLAHETTHVVLNNSSNHTGMTAVLDSVWWFASLAQTGTTLMAAFDETLATAPWSRRIGAAVDMTAIAQSPDKQYCHPVLRTVRLLVLPPENKAALIRLLGGILAALSLILILVLTALTRHPDRLTFLLVMLAACLHFGRRDEPDDHGFLPMRWKQMSSGSCQFR